MTEKMTKGDRDALIRIGKARARQAKTEVKQREKVLLAEVEDLLTAEFSARDEMWNAAVKIAKEAATKANEVIQAQCADLGIPAKFAPSLEMGWRARNRDFEDPKRRAELRKRAQAQLAALTATAETMIDAKSLELEEQLILGGLETSEARAFIESMPTVEELMPALSLDDVGVKHWQPPTDAASALLTPSTTADRKRKQVLRAIEANPGASNRAIAELTGVDHKTVGKYRADRGESVGNSPEIPHAGSEEIPGQAQLTVVQGDAS